MRKSLILVAMLGAAASMAGATEPPAWPVLAPAEIVAAAPQGDWTAIAASDLLVMDLAADAQGRARRVVIQLLTPPFAQGWIGNIRQLAAAHWWDGTSVNRVQDNYVVQWGDGEAEDKARAKPLPPGLAAVPETAYRADAGQVLGVLGGNDAPLRKLLTADPYGAATFVLGWPVSVADAIGADGDLASGFADPLGKGFAPVHCYGMVGVGRDMPPDTGSGAELYAVIGQAPRHLDRNIALVGRVIEGIEHLSSLPRGSGALGFYASAAERTAILAVRLGSAVPELPTYEYLSTESASFARYAEARANRRDAFFIHPAGGADVCNVPVPVRRVAG